MSEDVKSPLQGFKRALNTESPEAKEQVSVLPQPEPEKEEATTVTVPVKSEESAPQTINVVSGIDAYIRERMVEQPKTLEAVDKKVDRLRNLGARHRLILPGFFEKQSHDCTWQEGCDIHINGSKGIFIFRWLFKEKRALDQAMNIVGWTLVNRTYFPSAPRGLFTANGGVENGDAILSFMPVKKALAVRKQPGEKSRETLKSRMRTVDRNKVIMTSDTSKDRYMPDMSPVKDGEETQYGPGEIVEGRDF